MFVGSAHWGQSILRLESEPNTHFVGVKPYEETLGFVEHFDVALIPHVDNDDDPFDESVEGVRLLRGRRPRRVDARSPTSASWRVS